MATTLLQRRARSAHQRSRRRTRSSVRKKNAEDARRLVKQIGWEALKRGEKRFRALNPFGCLDFVTGSEGLSEYLDMLMAHNSYWTSQSFNQFILSCMFFDEGKIQLAPRWDGFATPPSGSGTATPTPRDSSGSRPQPKRRTTQPFTVAPQEHKASDTPFTKSVSESAQHKDVLRVWAVDISGWHEEASAASIADLAKKLLPTDSDAVDKVTRYVRTVDKTRECGRFEGEA